MNAPPSIREKLLVLLRAGTPINPADIVKVIDGYERDLKFYGTRPTVAEWQDKCREAEEAHQAHESTIRQQDELRSTIEQLRAQLAAAEAKPAPHVSTCIHCDQPTGSHDEYCTFAAGPR